MAALLTLLAVSLAGGAAAGAIVGAALLSGIRLDPSTPQLISVVLLGIGIDYFLFLLFRFRERLGAQPERGAREIAGEVTGRVGSAITSAALTIVAAFATLGVTSFGQLRVLGPAVAISVVVMLLASLTFMPALGRLQDVGQMAPVVHDKAGDAARAAARRAGPRPGPVRPHR
ncbi:MMPL family transporter [Streptomyces sp. NPDC006430]|uniref:MMPL family transporter n=1 Tax=Streptomyces sp. NPDC006430 TaxID=3154299 RepID=UPI0033A8F233